MSILSLAGASGVGKSTFMRTFLKVVPKSTILPSYTTRELRGSEITWDGVPEYYQLSRKEMLERDEVGEFLHVFGRDSHTYGTTLYATRVSDFEAALASKHVHLCALFVPGVEMFFDESRDRHKEHEMHAVFLDLKDEEERRRRLDQGGGRDQTRYVEELSQWRRLIGKSDAPFYLLEATSSPEELVRKTTEHFKLYSPA